MPRIVLAVSGFQAVQFLVASLFWLEALLVVAFNVGLCTLAWRNLSPQDRGTLTASLRILHGREDSPKPPGESDAGPNT